MTDNNSSRLIFTLLFLMVSISTVSAFQFNGTVKDTDGSLLNNSLINITVRNMNGFSVVGYNATFANASGWFNLTVSENAQWMYEPKITWANASTGAVEYIGQSLPAFPQEMIQQVAGTTFYLSAAGTINITAINSSGSRIPFEYQIKDQKLGYSIAANFGNHVNEAIINVPRNRNYSLMIYPNQSMPVSFNWNNFSSSASYNLSNISRYNVTTKTLAYQFNTTMVMKRVSGYLNYSGISGWNEFTVIPYLLEPGNMVHVEYGMLPYNISSETGTSDFYNMTSGFYNITLPGTVETSSIILFASAVNGSRNIGAVRNISLSMSSSGETAQFNFSSAAGMFGSFSNVTPTNLGGPPVNITLSKQNFTILNSTNSTVNNINGHIEVTVDYSSIGAIEFTWMTSISQGSSSSFLVPLLNNTGVKELNAFVGGGDYAPIRKSYTASQLGNRVNITLNSFNPGAIDEVLSASRITMALYISNSTCDIPNPSSSCLLGGSEQNMDTFNPMQSIMGGGKLSFRMGVGNISVHYVNVDMLASGPPDALFDSSTTESTGSSFESALRFGSNGPTIYDYVLISIPYTQGSSSQTGLNESGEINVSIPLFYDDSWNVIWNSTANGTNPTTFSNNNSHYAARVSEWAVLLNQSTCGTNQSNLNSTNPCYIDTANNKIWMRLPHFSGTGPSVTGGTVTAATVPAAETSSTSSGGSSGLSSGYWSNTYSENKKELSEMGSVTRELTAKQRIKLKVNGEDHHVGIVNVTSNSAIINVSSISQQRTLTVSEEWKVDINSDKIYDLLVRLNSIVNNKANITLSFINDKMLEERNDVVDDQEAQTSSEQETGELSSKGSWKWIIVGIILLAGIASAIISMRVRYNRR